MTKNLRKWLVFSLTLVILLALPLGAHALGFSDTANHWAKEYIDWASNAGYIKGYEDGTFRPGGFITRAEYLSITNQSAPSTLPTKPVVNLAPGAHYADVAPGSWYEQDVKKAMELGYIPTPKDGKAQLNPNEPITREEAIYILSYNQGWSRTSPGAYAFNDYGDISQDRIGYLGGAIEQGVINGYPDNTLRPKENLTRAEVVTMITKYKRGEEQKEEQRKKNFSKRPLSDWYWNITNDHATFSQGFYINDNQANAATKRFSPVDYQVIMENSSKRERWGGSCFGFATTVGLYNCYQFDVTGLNASGTDKINQIVPDAEYNPQSAINIFQSTWDTPSFQSFLNTSVHVWDHAGGGYGNSLGIEHTFNTVKDYLDRFEAGGSLPILALYWNESGSTVGHAVTPYSYKITGDKMEVMIYDPNHIANSIVIDKASGKIYGENFMTSSGSGPASVTNFTTLLVFDSYSYIQALDKATPPLSRYLVNYNDNVYNLVHNGKQKYVTNEQYPFSWNQEPDTQNKVYSVIPAGDYKLTGEKAAVDLEMVGQGQRMAVSSQAHSEINFGASSIDIKGQSGAFKVSITTNNKMPWGDTIQLEGHDVGKLSLEAKADQYILKGDQLTNIKLTGLDRNKTQELNIDTQENEVVIKAENNKLYIDQEKESDFDSVVDKDKQLKDDKYVKRDLADNLVGSWYGTGAIDNHYTDRYVYITHISGNDYLFTNRVILQDDPSSEFFTEQYASFDTTLNYLSVLPSHRTYGVTGEFINKSPTSNSGTWFLNSSGNRLSWEYSRDAKYHMDKY